MSSTYRRLRSTSLPLPCLALVGASGSGKTTLIEALVPRLRAAGRRVAVIKHAHHGFEPDQPGKDSWRVREAGATQVVVGSRGRWAVFGVEQDAADEPSLATLIARLDPTASDLVLAEGFSREPVTKIEVHRPSHGRAPVAWPHDPLVVAVASDVALATAAGVATLDLNDPDAIARFVLAHARVPMWDPMVKAI